VAVAAGCSCSPARIEPDIFTTRRRGHELG
jgi:hypothetical protein